MENWITEYLSCPNTGGRLKPISNDLAMRLHALALDGKLRNVMGRTVSAFSSQGLVSENGDWAYQVADGIICMLSEEAIDLRKIEK